MIRTRIFIENNALDLYDDVAAEFTYAIDDVKEFASRNTSFSKTITIPGSSTNNKLFGHVFEFTSSNPYDSSLPNVGTNFNPAVVANCVILVDNIQIFKGVLRLLQINVDQGTLEYECAVFGELGGFANAIANLKLENLDFSGYDHDWTVSNIQASWQSINASGYYYPLIDYGKVSTNKHDWQFKALRPAYYVREIIDKIIANSGYTYESSFLDTNLIKRLIIPQNTKVMQQRSTLVLGASITVASYTSSSNIAFTPNTLGDFSYSTPNREFTYTNPTSLTSDISLTFGGTVTAINPSLNTMQVQLYRNAVLIGLNTFVIDATPQNFSGIITANNVTFNQNDTFYLRIVINGEFNMTGGLLNVQSQNPEQLIPVNYGETIRMNEHIPKGIFQKDFITSIVKMFNLYITEDPNRDRHLIINPGTFFYQRGEDTLFAVNDFGDLLEVELGTYLIIEPGQSAFLDWTYKIDRAKPMVIRPMSELNARFFEYKYRPDNDYFNEQYQKKYDLGYGDRILDTGFSFGGDKETAQVIFSATPLVGYPGEDKVYSTILKLTNVGTPSQTEDATDHNIRIMQAKLKSTTSWQILNGATVLATLSEYGYAGNLDDPKTPENDINFGAPRELYFNLPSGEEYPNTNLFSGFWFDYVAEITDKDSKLLTAFVKLTELDIANLNFSRLIYIDGALWRLNKIIDFNTQDTTRCEFLRVIELTYT